MTTIQKTVALHLAGTDFQFIDSHRADLAAEDAWNTWAAERSPFSKHLPASVKVWGEREAMTIASGLMADRVYPSIVPLNWTREGEPASLSEMAAVRAIVERVYDADELGRIYAITLKFVRSTLARIQTDQATKKRTTEFAASLVGRRVGTFRDAQGRVVKTVEMTIAQPNHNGANHG